MFPFAKTIFSEDHRYAIDSERWKMRDIESNLVAVISRGNVSLQHGDYITQRDMDKVQADLEKFFSSEESKW